jgi:hypothetical protein
MQGCSSVPPAFQPAPHHNHHQLLTAAILLLFKPAISLPRTTFFDKQQLQDHLLPEHSVLQCPFKARLNMLTGCKNTGLF